MKIFIILISTVFLAYCSSNEGNESNLLFSHKLKSFSKAKKLMKRVYVGHQIAFYSGCKYEYKRVGSKEKAVVDGESCGYRPRKKSKRSKYIEWEHIVPAWAFGHTRKCWRDGDPKCKTKGRKCCKRVDPVFRAMESDLHNLQPAIGELNADRSNYSFAMIKGEPRLYGDVDFEVDFKARTTEPKEDVRGNIARVYYYMEKTYRVRISNKQRKLFAVWAKQDPLDEWERLRNERIKRIQGNGNPFIK